ncbi:conserved hypothetical protein [Coccidioides posadasii str. Silveira]|uniref:Uncharacterized protein n=1 Tax=Coccidioides posadasii (strain RMSCC 757 / Silveira) TaxID=443226 RepID=E9DEU3_COCPS|nr:conserved hypothetical protein [Coccidioides posadasii str. Silveira]
MSSGRRKSRRIDSHERADYTHWKKKRLSDISTTKFPIMGLRRTRSEDCRPYVRGLYGTCTEDGVCQPLFIIFCPPSLSLLNRKKSGQR